MNASAPTESLLAELRSLPRAYWVLVTGWFINRFGTFVYPFLTLLLTQRGHSASTVAWVLSVHGIGQLLASILGGYFSDRFGRRNTLVVGTLGNALAIFALYFADSPGAILLFMGLAGFGGGFYMPASNALIADIIPVHLRLRAYSAQRLALNAGFACGSAVAGFIFATSAFWLFAGDAASTAVFGLLAWTMLPHGVRAAGAEAAWSEAIRVLRRDRAFWALFAATVLSSLVFLQFGTTFALEVKHRGLQLDWFGWHLASEQVFGCLLAWNGLMVALFELPMTRWMQRFAARRVIMLGYLLLGGGFALNALPGGVGLLFVGMTIFTVGEMLSQPMRSAYVAQLAPVHMRGRYMGVLAMGATLAAAIGPHVAIPLHTCCPQTLWIACGLLGILAALTLNTGTQA